MSERLPSDRPGASSLHGDRGELEVTVSTVRLEELFAAVRRHVRLVVGVVFATVANTTPTTNRTCRRTAANNSSRRTVLTVTSSSPRSPWRLEAPGRSLGSRSDIYRYPSDRLTGTGCRQGRPPRPPSSWRADTRRPAGS